MNTVLFDLDGTLLPMDLDVFIKIYLGALKKKFDSMGHDGEKFVQYVLAGTKAMYKNDGSKTNEECFWNTFESLSNVLRSEVEDELNVFYKEVFPTLFDDEGKSLNMVKAVSVLKEKGYRLIMATNPLFPYLATYARVMWAGLNASDFEIITTYEDYSYAKPNIHYFEEVLSKANVDVKDCMMVGNDSLEDGIIESIGVPVYLVTDHLIHREDTPLKSTYHGSSEAFLKFVEGLDVVA